MEQIGVFTQSVIIALGLDIAPNTPIFIGYQNEEHIRNRHPYEYDLYYERIDEIIAAPTYIGINPNDHSILYVKEYEVHNDNIRVAVRMTKSGVYVARSLHLLSTVNLEHYLKRGTLKVLTDKENRVIK